MFDRLRLCCAGNEYPPASVIIEHGIYRGYVQNTIGPAIELFQGGYVEAPAGFFIEGAGSASVWAHVHTHG